MRIRNWILAGLVALPTAAWADGAPAPASNPSFDLRSESVREAIRDAAASQYGSDIAAAQAATAKAEADQEIVWLPEDAPAAALRILDHYDCDAKCCVGRDQHHAPMYVIENEELDSTSLVRTWQDPWLGGASRDAVPGAHLCASCLPPVSDDRSIGERMRDDLLGDLVGGLFNSLFSKP